ncbi:MAG: DEAD/DEAH box helicase [Desulfurococcaceae archaeon]
MTIILRVKKWLDEEEFKELVKIADYLGYQDGYRLFSINIGKALKNGYLPVDVKNLVEEYMEEDNLVDKIDSLLNEYSPVIQWDSIKGVVKIQLQKDLFNLVKNELRKYSYKYLGLDGDKVTVEILPYHGYDIYKYLKSISPEVVDIANVFTDKTLLIKPELRNIELRPYQKEALEKWLENGRKGIIALPTGSGKSIIAIAALVETSVRTLIVAYTKEQIQQWRDFILKYTNIPSHIIGLFYGEEKKLAPITITTYQSGYRYINTISPYFGLLVVDEVHHLPADKFKYIALHTLANYRMGLSATPTREDGKHEDLFPLLGGIVYYKHPSDLVEEGYLAPYKIITVKVKLKPDERKLYEQLRAKYRELVKGRKFEEILEEARRGYTHAVEALKVHSELRQLIAMSSSKIDKAVEIAKLEYERNNKVIIFTQYIDQAMEIARRLNALVLTGETPEIDRKKSLEEFKNSTRGILVVTTVGDEGLDIPDANVGIIVSGTGSRRQFIQRLGRLLRPKYRSMGAILYEIITEKTPEEYQARKRKTINLDDYP